MRISDWSSDVCSSDLHEAGAVIVGFERRQDRRKLILERDVDDRADHLADAADIVGGRLGRRGLRLGRGRLRRGRGLPGARLGGGLFGGGGFACHLVSSFLFFPEGGSPDWAPAFAGTQTN